MSDDVDIVTRLGRRAYTAYDALVRDLMGRYYDPGVAKGLAGAIVLGLLTVYGAITGLDGIGPAALGVTLLLAILAWGAYRSEQRWRA